MRRALLPLLLAACSSGLPALPTGIDEGAMDPKADPCTDFYQYACGGYVAAHPVPMGGGAVSRSDSAFYSTQVQVQAVLADTMSGSSMTPEAQLVRAYHSACLAAGSSTDRTDLNRLLGVIDAITPDGGLAPALAELHRAGVDALFGFGPALDVTRPRQVIAQVYDNGIGLPDRAYYLDPAMNGVLQPYRDHITRLAQQLGVFDSPGLADAAISIETTLAGAMLTPEAYRDPLATHHPAQLSDFVRAHPAFDWPAYFAAAGAPAFTSLNVSIPVFFATVDQVLSSTPLADLKRYLRWRTLEALTFEHEDAIITEEYRFHFGEFYGFSTPLPRDELCVRMTTNRLEWEMSALYAARNAVGLGGRVQPMVDTVRDRLWDELGRLDWLDDPTLALVRQKLDAMRAGVSAPADFTPYLLAPLTLPSGFPAAELARRATAGARSLARIGGTYDREWFMSPITVNAAYSQRFNAINLPAAILQPPFYKASWPDAVNYGAIGAVVGHELTHGFDDQGRRFDGTGALSDMWPAAVAQGFADRAQCVVDQYSALDGVPGTRINGALTVGENIADLGGVKLAYLALAPKGAPLEGLTDAQTFFLAYAQTWCANVRPELQETLLQTDPHSPPRARVNAVLADTPQFATAWSCKEGQAMAPKNRCTVW